VSGSSPDTNNLLRRLDALAAERDALLHSLEDHPPDRVRRSPDASTWSVLQIVEHLVQSEEYCLLGHLPADRLEHRRRTFLQRLAYELVVAILRSPIRVSTPVEDMDPLGTESLKELAHRWRASHSRLREITLDVPDPRRDAVFRHPVAGPMTPAQAIRMLAAHQTRHIRQIDARLSNSPE